MHSDDVPELFCKIIVQSETDSSGLFLQSGGGLARKGYSMKSDIDKSLDLPTNFDATRMRKPVQSLEESGDE